MSSIGEDISFGSSLEIFEKFSSRIYEGEEPSLLHPIKRIRFNRNKRKFGKERFQNMLNFWNFLKKKNKIQELKNLCMAVDEFIDITTDERWKDCRYAFQKASIIRAVEAMIKKEDSENIDSLLNILDCERTKI